LSVKKLTAREYELLKCQDCGKTLGYIYVTVKTFPPKRYIRAVAGGPIEKIEKTAFCEDCFEKRKREVS